MSKRGRHRVAPIAGLAVVATAMAALAVEVSLGTRELDIEDAESFDVPRSPRFEVARSPSGPHPVVIAWEVSHCELPTFVLYDDGTWLRDPLEDHRCGEDLLSGQLAPEAWRAFHQSVLDADLGSMPAELYLRYLADGDSTTVAVREKGETWIATSVTGVPAAPAAGDPRARDASRGDARAGVVRARSATSTRFPSPSWR